MGPESGTAGVRIRYAVTAVIDVYHVGLAEVPGDPGGLVSLSGPLTEQILDGLDGAVRAHFLGYMTKAVLMFKHRKVARTELPFLGVASQRGQLTGDGAGSAVGGQHAEGAQ
jgi:hypothetical protein